MKTTEFNFFFMNYYITPDRYIYVYYVLLNVAIVVSSWRDVIFFYYKNVHNVYSVR